ncbi:MAG: patatin-like phospholipase family protein, partial [Acidobacteriota bacterium]
MTSAGTAGLAFAGGGASGAYAVGVARALLEGTDTTGGRPLDPAVIAGTSVGAVNAS